MFHLGWFLGNSFGVYGFNEPWAGTQVRDYAKPDFYIDFARAVERACFDYIMIEDGSYVPEALNGSMEAFLALPSGSPKHDPAVLIPIMAAVTERIGLVPTLSTSEYPPFLLARLVSTFDHISAGRAGWNVVTSRVDQVGQNHGHAGLPKHDDRYKIADEYVRLVKQLWHSWEPDAIVMDRERGVFADHTKVHRIDFEGEYFRSRGPLNASHMPQGEAVIVQAGASPAGRTFASRHAESVVGIGDGVAELKAYRQDMDLRLVEAGRKPNDCKIMYLVKPVLGETTAEAEEKQRRYEAYMASRIDFKLAMLAKHSQIDIGNIDIDEPMPETEIRDGGQPLAFFQRPENVGRTLREMMAEGAGGVIMGSNSIPFVGTPEAVAEQMKDANDEIGGDGFLIQNLFVNRRYVAEICDGLVPELQRKGLVRSAYTHDHFRDNLMEY
jgi:FMN-dependent oxidoreductase (nitrilotriacetate monooxygenase family)